MVVAYAITMRLTKVLLWGIAGAVGLMLAAGVASWFFPLLRGDLEQLLGLGVLIVLFFCVALGCAAALERGRAPRLMRSGITIGAVALAGWISMIWFADYTTKLTWQKILTWPTTWACLMMVMGLVLMPRPRAAWWMWLRRVTIVLLCLLSLHICLATSFYPAFDYNVTTPTQWERIWRYGEIVYRIGGVLTFLAGAGVAFTFLVLAVPGFADAASREVQRVSYWLQCPRCRSEQQALTGEYSCRQCGLHIRVEL